jgi:hypothetical protein
MGKLIDLSGRKFGKLEVLQQHKEKDAYGKIQWICKCECGNQVIVLGNNLRQGRSESCGCMRTENLRLSITTHGLTIGGKIPRFYRIWGGMNSRCKNPKTPTYKSYGARGITVCEDWGKFESFKHDMYESYLDHVKEYGENNTSIDRIDNDKGYCIENCRWATCEEQVINTRMRIDNSSGITGISQRDNGTWQAFIRRNGVKHSKSFKNLNAAIEWRKEKELNKSAWTGDGCHRL